jgi:hypothetical protein
MMGHRDRLKTALEYDVIYDRGLYCYLVNHGKNPKHFAKNQINRRARREAKKELRDYDDLG